MTLRKTNLKVWKVQASLSNDNELNTTFITSRDNRDDVIELVEENMAKGVSLNNIFELSKLYEADYIEV